MFKFLKSLFISEKEPEIEEVELSKLNNWFEDKVAKIGFNEQAINYFARIKEIKEQLPELIKDLNNAEVSKDNKNVEERVKNIVSGHRDNYSREIERFEENLTLLKKEKLESLSEYQEVIDYTKDLDKNIELLAKKTAKSYQAAQHLFFDPVEKLFKKTAELNTVVKEFEETIKIVHIEKFFAIKELIKDLTHNITKQKDFSKEVEERKEKENEIKASLKKRKEEKEKLKESQEYKDYQKVEDEVGEIEKRIKDNDNNVFSYFSKLNKPLRKYERVALDNKVIQAYVNDGLKSFWQDSELEIKQSLQGLKKALQENTIQFEDKQKNNFLELIKKSESGYLEELKELGEKLKAEREELLKKVEDAEIVLKIEETNKNINSENEKLISLQRKVEELKSKLEKIDLEKTKQEIIEKVNKKLKIKLKIK
jgi:hypothetical protein